MREAITTADGICQVANALKRRDGLFWITKSQKQIEDIGCTEPEGYDIFLPNYLSIVDRMNLISLMEIQDPRVRFMFELEEV
jgi:hypothetical protein